MLSCTILRLRFVCMIVLSINPWLSLGPQPWSPALAEQLVPYPTSSHHGSRLSVYLQFKLRLGVFQSVSWHTLGCAKSLVDPVSRRDLGGFGTRFVFGKDDLKVTNNLILYAFYTPDLPLIDKDLSVDCMHLCKQYEHNNSHLKIILDNTIFVWLSWFEISWLFWF